MAGVSDKNDSRPSLDTEAISGDDEADTYEEVKLDYSLLSSDILNPPSIPKQLGSETIDQVIAALTNVPDVKLENSSPRRKAPQLPPPTSSSGGRGSESRRKRSRSRDRRRDDRSSDEEYEDDDRHKRRRDSYHDDEHEYRSGGNREDLAAPFRRVSMAALRGRGRGRLRIRARGRGRGFLLEQARGLFAPRVARAKLVTSRKPPSDNYRDYQQPAPMAVQAATSGRGQFSVARGRNIFPEDEPGGAGRGRGQVRENALYKRFKQQHRLENEEKDDDIYYDGRKTRTRSKSYSSSSRSRSRSSSGSSGSGSDSDSDDSPRKKKKKKDKKKRKKHKKDKKKKKIKEEKDSSDEKEKDNWRIEMLQKMKSIKNLPPEQLEIEFHKTMAEKKRKEEEEKCLEMIKERQKLARKVKKDAEKAAKKAAKKKDSKERDSEENANSFYAGFSEAAIKMEQEDTRRSRPVSEEHEDVPTTYPAIFKPSFAEVPYVEQQGDPLDTPMPGGTEDGGYIPGDGEFMPRPTNTNPEEDDPYARAFEEHMNRARKSETREDVSWPAGALEESGLEDTQLTKEQMDMLQDQQRQAMDDKSKTVVSASKMFSKIRNRIKSKGPLKINLKINQKDQGIEPSGENTPAEGLSDGEHWPEDDSNALLHENDDANLARRMERMRRKKEAHDPGELEDGEHSPSPEPVRPHLRRKRLNKPEGRGGTPLLDEKLPVEEKEDGEIDYDGPPGSASHVAGLAAGGPFGGPPRRVGAPPPVSAAAPWPPQMVPPAPMGPAVSFIDTSVPPPHLMGAGVPPPQRPPPFGGPPPTGRLPPPLGMPPRMGVPPLMGVPPIYPPGPMAHIPPPMVGGGPRPLMQIPPPVSHAPPPVSDPFVSSSKDAYQSRHSAEQEMYGPRRFDEYDRRGGGDDRYDRSQQRERDRYDDRRGSEWRDERDRRDNRRDDRNRDRDYDERDRGRRRSSRDDRSHRRSREDNYSSGQSSRNNKDNNVYGEAISDDEGTFEKEEESTFDITKITRLVKEIAKHLEEKRHSLELRGPFKFNDNQPGLSKYVFVAQKMIDILDKAGYGEGRMNMCMFGMGLDKIKEEMLDAAAKGKLLPEVHGPKMVKMMSRCIKCYVAYYSGKKEDLASSSEDEDSGKGETRTVTTSLSAVLGLIKESAQEDNERARHSAEKQMIGPEDPRMKKIPDTITNPWDNLDTKSKVEKLKSFSALQNHFLKQLISKGMHAIDARKQAESADCMMCLVVSGWSDNMLKDMVDRWKRTILPEQSQLEEKRTGTNKTLFDQMVDFMSRHKTQFPDSIKNAAQQEEDPEQAILKRIRNIVERMLKFYMKGLGKLQEGRENTGNQQPTAPSDYQFNYLPEGLREDEKSGEGGGKSAGAKSAKSSTNNFFNMDAASEANKMFSSYNNVKRLSLDEEPDDLEPVSPDNGEIIKGMLPKQKYLMGALTIDYLQYKGVSYVYEICVHMSDTSSLEVFMVPTNLRQDKTVLEMLGFTYNPEDNKFMYVKPGGGMNRVYGELQALEKIMQFLREMRYEAKGDSKNTGLVLVTENTGELATWERFTRFYKQDTEVDSLVAGYGVLDYFVEDGGGLYSYVGPKMNREPDKTFYTWEFNSKGRLSENMSSSRASAVLNLLEDLLGEAPAYENFIKENCFRSGDERMIKVQRKEDIIKDLYALECHLCDALNERNMRKKIYTNGIFSPSTTAEWGDKAGFVAAKFIRFLVESGLSRPALRDRAVHAREKGIELQVDLDAFVKRMRKDEERTRCEQQIQTLIKVTEEFILSK